MSSYFLQLSALVAALAIMFSGTPSSFAVEHHQSAKKNRPTVGLALSGGGMRGSAHIGVLKVLEAEGIPIDFIAGTSAGAVIGGLYAAGVPCSRLEEAAEDRSLLRAYNNIPIWLRLAVVPCTTLPRLLGIHRYVGLYRGNAFAKFVDKFTPKDACNIEDTPIKFWAVTTDLLNGKPHIINKGPLGIALQASSAFPWLRKPVELDGKLLSDGGLVANLPIQQARDMGADIIISVDLNGKMKPVPQSDFRHIRTFHNRTANLMVSRLNAHCLKKADVMLVPDVGDIPFLSGKRSDSRKAEAAGEAAALEAMPKIRKLLNLPAVKTADQTATSVL